MIFFLRMYQYGISPLLGPRCRFYPCCSEYAIGVLKQHSFLKAIYLMIKRLSRCHPGHPGGIDHVPLS